MQALLLLQFERQFENLDIQSEFVENAMNAQASLSTPESEVNSLMMQVGLLPQLPCGLLCLPLPASQVLASSGSQQRRRTPATALQKAASSHLPVEDMRCYVPGH